MYDDCLDPVCSGCFIKRIAVHNRMTDQAGMTAYIVDMNIAKVQNSVNQMQDRAGGSWAGVRSSVSERSSGCGGLCV